MTPLDAPEERLRRRRFGQQLGRYTLGTLLGAGGSASVYLARLQGPHSFTRLVALKVIHEHLLIDRDFVSMLLDEANLSARLSHPAIAHTYELGEADGVPFIAMEFLSGQPLSRLYRRSFEEGRPLSFGLVAWLGAAAARALHHAHELRDADGLPLRIIHRDVSPENLFATRDGQIKVLDFGIATAQRRHSTTSLGEIKGKFRYMAPEYTLGESIDGRLDVFALGATLYEIALGVPAFDGADASAVAEQVLSGALRDPREVRADFPEALARCLQRALAADPEARFQTLDDFANELDGIARAQPGDPGRELTALVRELFAKELERENESVAELSALPQAPVADDTDTIQVLAAAAPQKRVGVRARAALVIPAVVALVALVAWVALLGRKPVEPPVHAAAPGAAPLPSAPQPAPSSDPGVSATGPATPAVPSVQPVPLRSAAGGRSVASERPAGEPGSSRRRSPASSGHGAPAAASGGLITDYPFP